MSTQRKWRRLRARFQLGLKKHSAAIVGALDLARWADLIALGEQVRCAWSARERR